ncbi:hypothetical protein ACFL96_15765 [Thermoproteota archaeon]
MKKAFGVVLIVILLLICIVSVRHSFSEDSEDFKRLDFSASSSRLKFFDPKEGRVYEYSAQDGELMTIWILEDLGQDLIEINPRRNKGKLIH